MHSCIDNISLSSFDENTSCAFSLFRTNPTTSTFLFNNSSTTKRPVLPVAPVTATFFTTSLVGINDNSALSLSSVDDNDDEIDLIVTTGRRENAFPLAIIHPNREMSVKLLPFIMIYLDDDMTVAMIMSYSVL